VETTWPSCFVQKLDVAYKMVGSSPSVGVLGFATCFKILGDLKPTLNYKGILSVCYFLGDTQSGVHCGRA
jgi:hypothetical protein